MKTLQEAGYQSLSLTQIDEDQEEQVEIKEESYESTPPIAKDKIIDTFMEVAEFETPSSKDQSMTTQDKTPELELSPKSSVDVISDEEKEQKKADEPLI